TAAILLVACSAGGQARDARAIPAGDTPPTLGRRTKTTGCHAADGLPDPACTPGADDPRVTPENVATTICRPGYSTGVRPPASVTDRIKRDQYTADGLDGLAPSAAELDHLVSLELGGAPADVANLWPEPYQHAWGARVKDRL